MAQDVPGAERPGHEVVEASNGVEGLERMSAAQPDLILRDLMMPVMDGFEFVQRLRESQQGRDVPIIVMTSKTLTDSEQQLLTGRVQEVLEKREQGPEAVLSEIERILGGAHRAVPGLVG